MNDTKLDKTSIAYADGFTTDDLKWIKEHPAGSISFEEYLSVLHQERQKGKPVEQIKRENNIPAVYAEASDGSLVRGNENYIVESEPADVFTEFGFYSVPDLTDEERKPPEFIIEGMIPCGMTFLAGAPKIRKSFLALQMAIAVATGTSFFGHETHQCDVAYFDLEGSKSRISARTDRMSAAIPRNVHITNQTKLKLSDGLVDKIRTLHRQRPEIRLYIIDTYSRARGYYKAGGANAYDADVTFLEPVQRMAIEEKIAIFFVHHDSKGAGFRSDPFERLSGSMGISGSADCVINLISEGKRFEGKASMEFTPRDAKGGELKLIFNSSTFEWMQLPDTPADIEGNPICRWIINHAPDRRKEGEFYPYEQVFSEAYHASIDKPGDKVVEQIKAHKDDLFQLYNIGVQTGVQSHSRRGIRIINLL